jgi:hypothetical protein
LVKNKSSLIENSVSNLGAGLGEITKDNKKESILIDISSRSKDDVGESDSKVGNVFVDQVLVEEELKVAKASGDLDDRSCKKAKLDDSAKASHDNKVKSTQKLRHDSNDSSSKAVAQITPAAEDKSRPNLTKDPQETNNALSEKPKPDEKLANGKFPEASLRQPSEEGSKTSYKIQEPTRRPATVSCIARSPFFPFIYQGLLLNNFNVVHPFT